MPCNELHPYVFSKKKQTRNCFMLTTAQGVETLGEDGGEPRDLGSNAKYRDFVI
jgi:hypothetical protein